MNCTTKTSDDSIQRTKDELNAADRLLNKAPHSKQEARAIADLQTRYDDAARRYKEYLMPGARHPNLNLKNLLRQFARHEL